MHAHNIQGLSIAGKDQQVLLLLGAHKLAVHKSSQSLRDHDLGGKGGRKKGLDAAALQRCSQEVSRYLSHASYPRQAANADKAGLEHQGEVGLLL